MSPPELLPLPGDRFVRSQLKIRHLVLLVELGRHGSVVQAAQAANLTQPAASKLLGDIERGLGVQLFERLPRGVAPTWFGRLMIRHAQAALGEMHGAYQEVMDLVSGLHGVVAIGTEAAPMATLVAPAIGLLRSRHAQVQVALEIGEGAALVDWLRAGRIDIAVGCLPAQAADLDFTPAAKEPHGLVAGPRHRLRTRRHLHLGHLAGQGWILPPAGSALRERLLALFAERGMDAPLESVATSDPQAASALLACTDLVAVLPLDAVRTQLANGSLVLLPVHLPLRMDSRGIATRRQQPLTPEAEALLTALKATSARKVI